MAISGVSPTENRQDQQLLRAQIELTGSQKSRVELYVKIAMSTKCTLHPEASQKKLG